MVGKKTYIVIIVTGMVLTGFANIDVPEEKGEELRVCEVGRNEPFIPLLYIIDVDSSDRVDKSKVWGYAKENETKLNSSSAWQEMINGAVSENNIYYDKCSVLSGKCGREYNNNGRGIKIPCFPQFKILGVFQDYLAFPERDCSQYNGDWDKCESTKGCYVRSGNCIYRSNVRTPVNIENGYDDSYCMVWYIEGYGCPLSRGCFPSPDTKGSECRAAYCDDFQSQLDCERFSKCKWEERKDNDKECKKITSCSQITEREQCNKSGVCEWRKWWENFQVKERCWNKYISYSDFLLYKYHKLWENVSADIKKEMLSTFYCNVLLLKNLDLYPFHYQKLIYDGWGCGTGACATLNGYRSWYAAPVTSHYIIGHELGHNAGLMHYNISKLDPFGMFEKEISPYLAEDFPEIFEPPYAKFFGKSKDGIGNPGKYGIFYTINDKEISETDNTSDPSCIKYDKLKTLVYEIENCAKNSVPPKPYRVGGELNKIKNIELGLEFNLPAQEKFDEFSGYTDEQCKQNEECKKFVENALKFYKAYIKYAHILTYGNGDPILPDIKQENCLFGKKALINNPMDVNECRDKNCHHFTSYQIYQRWNGGRPKKVQQWMYMSLYDKQSNLPTDPKDISEEDVYFDLTKPPGTGGAYGLKQKVINIFKEMARYAGLENYAVPVFEEKGDNTTEPGFYIWLEEIRDTLVISALQQVQAGLVCPPGYPTLRDIISRTISHIKYELTQESLIRD